MKRCVLPTGSSAARWRQACARFYSTADAEKPAKRARGRPPKTRTEDRLQPNDKDVESGNGSLAAEAIAAAIVPAPTSSDDTTKELQKPASKRRGRPPKTIKLEQLDAMVTDIKVEPPTSISSLPAEAIATSLLSSSLPKPESTTSDHVHLFRRERPLPISPLMDLEFLAARERHKIRKAPPTKGAPGSLHARLAKNPYALALDTPIRSCKVTGALLPAFFLQDYNMMAHPESGEPWYVPVSLTKHKGEMSNENEQKRNKKKAREELSGLASSEPSGAKDMKEDAILKNGDSGKKIGYNVYTISSKLTIDQMQQNRFHPSRLIPQRLRRIPSASKVAGSAGWREDMGSFLCTLWRRRISEYLTYVKGLKNGYMINCTDWEDAKSKSQIGAFLWAGKSDETGSPKQWATLDVAYGHEVFGETRKVPVYNLRALLGDEALDRLTTGEDGAKPVLGSRLIVVKDKNATLELRMKLWKFQGFMAVPEAEEVVYEDEDLDDDIDVDDDEDEDEDFEDEEHEEIRTPREDWTMRPQQTEQPREMNHPPQKARGFTIRRESSHARKH